MSAISSTLPLLHKDPRKAVTIYVWHSDAVSLALGKVYNRAKEAQGKDGKKINLNPYTGHAAIQVGDDPDNYISLWGGAALHTKEDDVRYFSEKRGAGNPDIEVKLYSLKIDKMLEFIDKFKIMRNRGQINFSLYNIWQYDETSDYNCSCLVQTLLNIGGIWDLVKPQIDRKQGAIKGAVVGAIVGATTPWIGGGGAATISAIPMSDAGVFVGTLVVAIFSGAAAFIVGVSQLTPIAGMFIGAGVGAIVGGITGEGINLSDIERKLSVTPTDVANLANLLSVTEEKKYTLVNYPSNQAHKSSAIASSSSSSNSSIPVISDNPFTLLPSPSYNQNDGENLISSVSPRS